MAPSTKRPREVPSFDQVMMLKKNLEMRAQSMQKKYTRKSPETIAENPVPCAKKKARRNSSHTHSTTTNTLPLAEFRNQIQQVQEADAHILEFDEDSRSILTQHETTSQGVPPITSQREDDSQQFVTSQHVENFEHDSSAAPLQDDDSERTPFNTSQGQDDPEWNPPSKQACPGQTPILRKRRLGYEVSEEIGDMDVKKNKKPLAWNVFMTHHMTKLKVEAPELNGRQKMQRVAAAWRAISEPQRKMWEHRAAGEAHTNDLHYHHPDKIAPERGMDNLEIKAMNVEFQPPTDPSTLNSRKHILSSMNECSPTGDAFTKEKCARKFGSNLSTSSRFSPAPQPRKCAISLPSLDSPDEEQKQTTEFRSLPKKMKRHESVLRASVTDKVHIEPSVPLQKKQCSSSEPKMNGKIMRAADFTNNLQSMIEKMEEQAESKRRSMYASGISDCKKAIQSGSTRERTALNEVDSNQPQVSTTLKTELRGLLSEFAIISEGAEKEQARSKKADARCSMNLDNLHEKFNQGKLKLQGFIDKTKAKLSSYGREVEQFEKNKARKRLEQRAKAQRQLEQLRLAFSSMDEKPLSEESLSAGSD